MLIPDITFDPKSYDGFPLTSSALALLLLSNVAQSDGVSLVRFFPQEVSVTGQCLDHSSLEPLVGVSTVNSSIMENFNIISLKTVIKLKLKPDNC